MKTTTEVPERAGPPVPLSAMVWGVAEMKLIEPAPLPDEAPPLPEAPVSEPSTVKCELPPSLHPRISKLPSIRANTLFDKHFMVNIPPAFETDVSARHKKNIYEWARTRSYKTNQSAHDGYLCQFLF